MNKKIDFLGIGAPKAATTWLDANLRKHPEIWMPPIKEIHYFDRSPRYKSAGRRLLKKYRKRSFLTKKFKKGGIKKTVISALKEPRKTIWMYRYLNSKPDDKWYLDLFKQGKGKKTGEITPLYSILDKKDVQHVKNLLPDVKIIYFIRNPIYRFWSNIRFHWMRKPSFDIDDINSIKKLIDCSRYSLMGDYIRTIDLWKSIFGKDQFFIGFHDDVKKNPEELYKDVTGFIGADQNFVPGDLKRKIHVSKEHPMPPEIKHYLAEKYHPRLKQLSKMLGGHTETWLGETESILNLG